MSTGNHINKFTAVDIERYHQGLLSSKERHDLEKAALDDPFLADALEGYGDTPVNISQDISLLKQQLADRIAEEKTKVVAIPSGGRNAIPWLRVAAMIILIAGAAWLTYEFGFNKKPAELAVTDDKPKKENTDISTPVDSTPNIVINPPAGDTSTNMVGSMENKEGVDYPGNKTISTPKVPEADYTFTKPSIEAEVVTTNTPQKTTRDTELERTDAAKAQADKLIAKDDNAANAELYKKEQKALEARKRSVSPPTGNSIYRNQENRNQNTYSPVTFHGRVTDANNNGLPFANVTNVEDGVGTYTDAKGNFTLTNTDSVLNVQIRALGYNSNNIQLRGGDNESLQDLQQQQNRNRNYTSTRNETAASRAAPVNQVVLEEDRGVAAHTLSDRKVNSERRSRDANFKLEGEPEPADGWENYDSYLTNNLNIPDDLLKAKQTTTLTGTVDVSFEVTKSGAPVNIRVEKSLCAKCDEEAIRLIKDGPKWKRKARNKRTTVTIAF